MTTSLDSPLAPSIDPGEKLRTSMAAMRLSWTWFGTSKSLSSEQKAQAADTFHAEGKYLRAGKKLVDTSDPSYRAVTAFRTQANAYFKSTSLPYPEPGIRLVPQGSLDQINDRMDAFCTELANAVGELDTRFDELKFEARDRLGDLFCEGDYPTSLHGLFQLDWNHPSIEPPEYLKRLNPKLYHQECERVKARFDESVQMAEVAFAEELSKMVEHLADRLAGVEDGKVRVFRDSTVQNITNDFFLRYKTLNIGSSEELDEVVERARQVLDGVAPQSLRDSESLRTRIGSQMAVVQASLDGLMVGRGRRNILRRAK